MEVGDSMRRFKRVHAFTNAVILLDGFKIT